MVLPVVEGSHCSVRQTVLCVVFSGFHTVGVGESLPLTVHTCHLLGRPFVPLSVCSTSFTSFAAPLMSAESQSGTIYFSLLVQFEECQTPFKELSPL